MKSSHFYSFKNQRLFNNNNKINDFPKLNDLKLEAQNSVNRSMKRGLNIIPSDTGDNNVVFLHQSNFPVDIFEDNCKYILVEDITYDGNAFSIYGEANNISVDFNGHKIKMTGGCAGILLMGNNISVTNGIIELENLSRPFVQMLGIGGDYVTVDNIHFLNMGTNTGFKLGIYTESAIGWTISNCIFSNLFQGVSMSIDPHTPSPEGRKNITIKHNKFKDCQSFSILIIGGKFVLPNWLTANVSIHDCQFDQPDGTFGIHIADNVHNLTISDVHVEGGCCGIAVTNAYSVYKTLDTGDSANNVCINNCSFNNQSYTLTPYNGLNYSGCGIYLNETIKDCSIKNCR
jgi:hypothetical protein